MSADDWFSRLEQQLEQQLDAFLQANPGQARQLELQEQRERLERLQRQRLELQSGAERVRQELINLAAEIAQWQERVERARNAGATELAERAEAHLAGLMARGRDRWQALADLGASLQQLEADNRRLRGLLELQQRGDDLVGAAVISRRADGWWQQLLLGRGSLQGLEAGDPVLAPGGLLGRIASVTPTTAMVTLLTDPASRIGVWVPRTRQHALLVGAGSPRPLLRFIQQDVGVRPGDLVTTSPASTLLPPNLTIGVVQSINDRAVPAPEAVVQLSAPVDAVDWVQVPRHPR